MAFYKKIGVVSITAMLLTPMLCSAQKLIIDGELNVSKKLIIPATQTWPKNDCTPGEIRIGNGGGNSKGKGGWLYFCRLGGTWAAADFSNVGLGVESNKRDDELMLLKAEVLALKGLVCANNASSLVCKEQQ